MAGKDLIVQVYPGQHGEASFYEDDGETMAFASGAFACRRFLQRRGADDFELQIDAPEGVGDRRHGTGVWKAWACRTFARSGMGGGG